MLIAVVVVVINIVVAVIVSGAFRNRDVNVIEVSFTQQMEANIMDLEHEQQDDEHAQPPASRGWLSKSSRLLASSHYQFVLFQSQNMVRLILSGRVSVKLFSIQLRRAVALSMPVPMMNVGKVRVTVNQFLVTMLV